MSSPVVSRDDLSRIVILETALENHDKQITEIKQDHKEFSRLLFSKIEKMRGAIEQVSSSNQSMSLENQKAMNKVLSGIIIQIIVGIVVAVVAGLFLFYFTQGTI